MKKRGQVTIFIIVAIVIVSAVVLFFLFRGIVQVQRTEDIAEKNPDAFLESCLEEKIKEGVGVISLQGGYVNPVLHRSFKFEGEDSPEKISYLCYTQNDYIPCINQEPMLISHLENEIEDYISGDVENCFDSLVSSLKKQGYDVNPKYNEFNVELTEKKVIVNVDAEITLTKAGETTKQEGFKVVVLDRLYDLAVVVQRIVSSETISCDFERTGFMILYPEWNIDIEQSDSTIIYIVEHKETQKKFRFAIRGCVIPAGYF